jgi:hypothetical protein
MIKMKMLTFTLALLMSMTLLSTCKAQTEQASVKFSGIAVGECQVLIEGAIGPPLPKETFIGQGTMVFGGSADADEYPPNQNVPYTFYVTYESVRALGVVSARWNGQMINVFLYSEGDVRGFFVDEGEMRDLFTVGVFPGESPWNPSLSYKGIYKDVTGTHIVSGKAAVVAILVGPHDAPIEQLVMVMGVFLFKPDNTPLLGLIWVPVDTSALNLHAANRFMHSVEIITAP